MGNRDLCCHLALLCPVAARVCRERTLSNMVCSLTSSLPSAYTLQEYETNFALSFLCCIFALHLCPSSRNHKRSGLTLCVKCVLQSLLTPLMTGLDFTKHFFPNEYFHHHLWGYLSFELWSSGGKDLPCFALCLAGKQSLVVVSWRQIRSLARWIEQKHLQSILKYANHQKCDTDRPAQ